MNTSLMYNQTDNFYCVLQQISHDFAEYQEGYDYVIKYQK